MGILFREVDNRGILEWSQKNSKATWFVWSEYFKNFQYVSSEKQTTAKFLKNA